MKLGTKYGTGQRILVVGSDPAVIPVVRNLPGDVEFAGLDGSVVRRVSGEVGSASVVEDASQFSIPDGDLDGAVVATHLDRANFLLSQRLRIETDTDVVTRVNDPGYVDLFERLDVESVRTARQIGGSLLETLHQRAESRE